LQTALTVDELAKSHQLVASANMLVVTGHRLSSRFATGTAAPSLLAGTIQPSRGGYCPEPLFDGNWNRFPEQSILSVEKTLRSRSINCKDVTNSVSTNTLEQRQQLKQWLHQCRLGTLALFEGWIMPRSAKAHPDFSPVGWHLGHIAYIESLVTRARGGNSCCSQNTCLSLMVYLRQSVSIYHH